MSKKNNLYLGKAGQSLVMSEFLARGWNVAIPEVDVGDDLFVVDLHEKKQIGSLHSGNITLYMVFKEDKVTCSSVDFTSFIDNYRDFPLIVH